MSEHSLPKEYKGFSTGELLEIWKTFPDRTMDDPPIPDDKNAAWSDLLREYDLLDFGEDGNDTEKIKRSKQMMAPYGIDPAPWADENGVEQDNLREAHLANLRRKEKEWRERNKAKRAEKLRQEEHARQERDKNR